MSAGVANLPSSTSNFILIQFIFRFTNKIFLYVEGAAKKTSTGQYHCRRFKSCNPPQVGCGPPLIYIA